MAVYLEVVPQSGRMASGGETAGGPQCLVFFLGGAPTSGARHTGGSNILFGDGSVRFARDLNEIAAELSRTPATGSIIILGPTNQPGYMTTRWQLTPGSKHVPSLGLTSTGQAVLIGLLLPAVQAAREAAKRKAPSGPIQQLKSLVGPTGHVFVIGSDGALLSL